MFLKGYRMYRFFLEKFMNNFYVAERIFGITWQRKHHLLDEGPDRWPKRRVNWIKI
jgi:hypothetical protein